MTANGVVQPTNFIICLQFEFLRLASVHYLFQPNRRHFFITIFNVSSPQLTPMQQLHFHYPHILLMINIFIIAFNMQMDG